MAEAEAVKEFSIRLECFIAVGNITIRGGSSKIFGLSLRFGGLETRIAIFECPEVGGCCQVLGTTCATLLPIQTFSRWRQDSRIFGWELLTFFVLLIARSIKSF